MNRYTLTLVVTLVCATSMYFLAGKPEQPSVALSPISEAAPVATSNQAKPSTDDGGEKVVVAETEAVVVLEEPLSIDFEPPFPNRTSLFQAPKRQGRGKAKATGQSETSVELLGFVNVDGQRVALSIDGLVTMAAEGEKQFGIEVISIQPPSVVLQRGRQRWQASFEN